MPSPTTAARSLPDSTKARNAKVADRQNIKILYGCEGYYVNDVDDRIAVHGSLDASFDDEYVAFDLETTGLSSQHDTIIEIGAAIMKRDAGDRSPSRPLSTPEDACCPKIIDLTGITDQMLEGAPSIEEVLPKFLDFVGGRPLWRAQRRF